MQFPGMYRLPASLPRRASLVCRPISHGIIQIVEDKWAALDGVVSSERACELESYRFGLLPMNDTDHDLQGPLAGIPAQAIAQWEQWGVDVIENDLKMRNGIGYVGSRVQEAWRWVKHKRAQENAASAANSITIGVMTGSTIQQGSPNATQTVSSDLDLGDV